MNEPIIATIGFLVTPTQVCLAPKLRKVGVGKLNGYGGKKNAHESITDCLVREVSRESGVVFSAKDVAHITTLDFFIEYSNTFRCHIFLITRWSGNPKATKEMGEPEFHPRDNLPLNRIMKGRVIPNGGYVIYNRTQTETLFCHLPPSI